MPIRHSEERSDEESYHAMRGMPDKHIRGNCRIRLLRDSRSFFRSLGRSEDPLFHI